MDRRQFLTSAAAVPAGLLVSPIVSATVVHQPFVLGLYSPEKLLSALPGDVIRCEAGCDYAEVVAQGQPDRLNDWAPKLQMLNGNPDPFGQILPVKCKCGAVAIKWEEDA